MIDTNIQFEPALKYWYSQCRNYMLSINHQFDTSHRIDHIDRVLKNALCIASTHNANLYVVVPAVLMHDCIPVDKRSPLRSKASRMSADEAARKLKKWGYPYPISPISEAIASHSFSAGLPARTLEAQVVQDADRLDSLGAIGIARCFSLGGVFGNQLYHADDPQGLDRALNDKAYTLDHFYQKLLSLHETFLTDKGRMMAFDRTEYMRQFIAKLMKEIEQPALLIQG